ncbi:MAG: hypothetical protein BWY76_00187 [bacterium ADurb.Bin429]|nr:MAG: hypothetical protein BWY76_00187 [bacterium ADurb.Bin429]
MTIPVTFFPYLYVETARKIPSSIVIAAVMGQRQKRVILTEAAALPWPAQAEAVGALIRAHYAETGGDCFLFGAIEGYVLRLTPELAYRFGTDGALQEGPLTDFHEDGVAIAMIGDQPFTFRE